MSSRQRVTGSETYQVVYLPKTFTERCQDCGNALGRACAPCYPIWKFLGYAFLILFVIAVAKSCLWIVGLLSSCQKSPVLGLEDVSIHDMVVYPDPVATDTSWLVRSNISVTLTTSNPNTVSGCFTTCRRIVVHVYFKEQLLLQQEVPLGFKLKPKGKRPVVLDLQGDGFTVQQDLGSLLQVDLQNATSVDLKFTFSTRFLRNDHKAGWMNICCDLEASTPLYSSSQLNSDGGLVWSSCYFC